MGFATLASQNCFFEETADGSSASVFHMLNKTLFFSLFNGEGSYLVCISAD